MGLKMRVKGYIDGMNFYEASKDKKWYPAGWCNWRETIAGYCPGAEISICYFTTLYRGRNVKRQERQDLHLRAMREVAKAEIIEGSCRERPLKCPECKTAIRCTCGCTSRLTEKMTDVNIAVRLIEDAVDDRFDRAYLVTADVDLIPAIHAVLRRHPHSRVDVLLPPETVMADEFQDLDRTYPGRAIAKYLDVEKLLRFPDDLPNRWRKTLPSHWARDAGPRPAKPDQAVAPTSRRSGPVPRY